jgi:formylglycine-generating enzyme required for sulfatase activity
MESVTMEFVTTELVTTPVRRTAGREGAPRGSRGSRTLRWPRAGRPGALLALVLAIAFTAGCVVEERCYRDSDCAAPLVCNASGVCAGECLDDDDCGPGFVCRALRCELSGGRSDAGGDATAPLVCPADMVAVADAYCIDRYEASRPDATAASAGTLDSRALSRAGVVPWQVADNATAAAACAAAGKRLCTPAEWELACRGPAGTEYAYGDTYEPETCNGIDAFGRANFRLVPTGSFPACTNGWGVFDINGNLWEHVAGGDDRAIRGGAYNCGDSAALHRCGYIPRTWEPSARGFRCCSGGTSAPPADVVEGPRDTVDAGGAGEQDGGCIEDPDIVLPPVDVPRADVPRADVPPADVPPADVPPADSGAADAAPVDSRDAHGEDAAPAPDGSAAACPADMVLVALPGLRVCLDRYEASHEDATATTVGTAPVAASRAGVLPWVQGGLPLETARAACAAADKRLCRLDEWFGACTGARGTVYSYGDTYDPAICNGIDAFCRCADPACASVPECPYAHCYSRPAADGSGGPCGAVFHIAPTGSFPDCRSEFGAFDVNGNVWELADSDDGQRHFRGGAYNCGDSEALHRCDHDGTWGPSAQGFRCCRDAE